jgi:hypothetical protein
VSGTKIKAKKCATCSYSRRLRGRWLSGIRDCGRWDHFVYASDSGCNEWEQTLAAGQAGGGMQSEASEFPM